MSIEPQEGTYFKIPLLLREIQNVHKHKYCRIEYPGSTIYQSHKPHNVQYILINYYYFPRHGGFYFGF